MTDCATYRRTLMADPHDPDPALREHRSGCEECNLYADRLLRFESRLERALRVPQAAQSSAAAAPPGIATTPLRAPLYRKRWLAMAASFLVAAIVAGGLWLGVPRSSLAADVVTHMREEPQAWRRTDVPVPNSALQGVLDDSHLRLSNGAGLVSYANSCGFRGHQVPHLVIQTASGPVTVMVLVHEAAKRTEPFEEQGYRGVIVPVAGHGSLAVLTQGTTTDIKTIERIASRVLDSIVWTS
jgi:Protein of unknown function (DUF3379)